MMKETHLQKIIVVFFVVTNLSRHRKTLETQMEIKAFTAFHRYTPQTILTVCALDTVTPCVRVVGRAAYACATTIKIWMSTVKIVVGATVFRHCRKYSTPAWAHRLCCGRFIHCITLLLCCKSVYLFCFDKLIKSNLSACCWKRNSK